MRCTHTFVTLPISPAAFDEIKGRLAAAGYEHTFVDGETIDMAGIALEKESEGEGATCTTQRP